jgi:hypothetical protein
LPKPIGKGQLNSQFGLYVERNFHVVSYLGSRRYLDRTGTNMVIQTRNRKSRSQVWYFDHRSKTIKSRIDNKSWSTGRNGNIGVYTTNS